MGFKEDLEKITAGQRDKVSAEELEKNKRYQEQIKAEGKADELLARIAKEKALMKSFIRESRILELLQQAGRILHRGQETHVYFSLKMISQSDTLFSQKVWDEAFVSITKDRIIKGEILSAEMHHADIRLGLDSVSVLAPTVSGQKGGPGGEDEPSYMSVPVGIGFYMDRNGNFYRPGILNLFTRVATRAQWQRSSDPLEHAIKNELNAYFQRPR